jgi:hypothetical protein
LLASNAVWAGKERDMADADEDLAEFDELLNRYLDGSANRVEVARLESRLLADEQFARHASRWCLMHRQIAELMTEDALHQIMDQFVQGVPGPPKGVFSQGAFKDRAGAEARPARRSVLIYAVAAAVLVATGIGAVALRRGQPPIAAPPTGPGDIALARPAPMGDAIIATLTRVVDGVWAAGAPPLHPGDQLSVGSRVVLASGMAKVTFECGAEVVLEGPCDFEIQSQMLGYLNSGKITADVPRRAFGFAILSPGVDFVDLGTSFGVNVGGDGRTQLHVFDGEVLCSLAKADVSDRNEAIHVRANRAVEFGAGDGAASDIAMDTADFSKLIALRRSAIVNAQKLPMRELALWLAADAAVATDAQGRVVSWQDLVYGDNQSAEDAIQRDAAARPMLAANAVHNRPAIRFDGDSDFLLTTPLETTDDQTVTLVCQFSHSAFEPGRQWGGQILNYDGPPSRYLSNLLEPGVLQIGEPLLEDQFRPSLVTAQVFAGFIGSATVEAGRVDGAQIGADMPVIVSYIYDYGRRRAELWINGRSTGAARAFAPQGITSRKIIGRHAWMQNFFHGDLAELLIYNTAQSPDELAASTAYLAEKYKIETEQKD